ncbi:hypothetical protein DET54_1353 [Paenibacillus pabuli]|uniref:Uncharacterized protein n=1 Tax=Paenibacillus pabuli TaxID=1472 RepID=A0ABX9BAU1_9BACL|nr:hypothetical protein DET54_1353 [Paenibacillus pabuli]
MDEGQGSCEELGTTAKNPPAYREQHGMKEDAVNWGDPPPHGFFFFLLGIRKETFYKSTGRSETSVGRESEGLIVPKNPRTT